MKRHLIVAGLAIAGGIMLWSQFIETLFPAPRPAQATARIEATSRAALDARIDEMRRRAVADPGDGEAAVILADALMRAARVHSDAALPLEAERVLKATLQHGRDYPALRMLAAVYLSQHRFSEALETATQASAANPEDAWNYATAGDALLELGRYDDAFEMFDQAARRRPDAGVYARVAYARELQGDLAGAVQVMKMAAEATPPLDVEAGAWVHTQLGLLHLQQSQLSDARREFDRAEGLFPGHPYPLTGQVKLAMNGGDYANALQLLERVPATPESLAMRGDLLSALGRVPEAEAMYRESERLERDGWKSEQPQPGALARFLAERDRKIPEAVSLAERAASERQDIHTMDALAWSYFKAGRITDARTAIRRALRTGTMDARIRCHAAVIADVVRTGSTGTSAFARATADRSTFATSGRRAARPTALVGRAASQTVPAGRCPPLGRAEDQPL